MKGWKEVFGSCHSDVWLCSTITVTGSILIPQIRLWVTYWLCNLYLAGLLALALMEFCGGFIIMERRILRSDFIQYPSRQLLSATLTDVRRLKLEALPLTMPS